MTVSYDSYLAKYREAARLAFEGVRRQIETAGKVNYWRFGTTFDTMTDYLWLLKNSSDGQDRFAYDSYQAWCEKEVQKDWSERTDPYAQYLNGMVRDYTACCYDDFCWWGIASAKALPASPYYTLFVDLFGVDGTEDFQKAAKAIWNLVYAGDYGSVVQSVPTSFPGYDAFQEDYGKRPNFHGGSPNAWDRVHSGKHPDLKAAYDGAQATVTDVTPRYPGGMWQYDYYWDPNYEWNKDTLNQNDKTQNPCHYHYQFEDPTHPYKNCGKSSFGHGAAQERCGQCGDPKSLPHPIGPFQLTLMSGLILVYASRMHSWTLEAEDGPYSAAATDVMGFLEQWFGDDNSLLMPSSTGKAAGKIVRERVPTYGYEADGKYAPMEGATANGKQRFWCGDQGLILGGLVEYQAGGGIVEDSTWIGELVAGTLDKEGRFLQDEPPYQANNSIQPYSPAFDGDGWGLGKLFCDEDYWSGAGIFWRYLFQTFKTNDQVHGAVLDLLGSDPDNAIFHSAEQAARLAPDHPWQPETAWSQAPLFKWFNPLATLTTAIYVMEEYEAGTSPTAG